MFLTYKEKKGSDYDNCKRLNKPQEEKHFECEVCTKLFNKKDKLIVHMSQHTGGKQYKCKRCSKFKMFAHNVDLKKHSRMNTGEKP